jgi:translation initiation factor 2B subunit (eIF-2B alpha/beta/delta family)
MQSELPEDIRARVSEIQCDNTSGSVPLTRRAAEIFLRLAEDREFSSVDVVIETGRALVASQPTMAPVFNLVNSVLHAIGSQRDLAVIQNRLKSATRSFLDNLEQAGWSVSEHATMLIEDGMSVLTHSHSDTVRSALLAAHRAGKRIEIICTESRPMLEGAALARKLAEEGMRVTLITDAAVLLKLRDAQMALVGADAVTTEGIVNKTGTSLVALAAGRLKKPAYALCGSEKFLPAGRTPAREPMKSPAQILEEEVLHLSVSNYYFETTPLNWLTGIVTEDGILKPAQIRRRLARGKVHDALAQTERPASPEPAAQTL